MQLNAAQIRTEAALARVLDALDAEVRSMPESEERAILADVIRHMRLMAYEPTNALPPA